MPPEYVALVVSWLDDRGLPPLNGEIPGGRRRQGGAAQDRAPASVPALPGARPRPTISMAALGFDVAEVLTLPTDGNAAFDAFLDARPVIASSPRDLR